MIELHPAARRARDIPAFVAAELGGSLELLLADIDLVTAERRVVGQQGPWQRIVVLAHPQEAAEAHDRIRDLAADLVDHNALYLAHPVAVGPVDRRALDLVAADQAGSLAALELDDGILKLLAHVFFSSTE